MNITVKTQLIAGFTFLLLLMALIAGVGMYRLNGINDRLNDIVEGSAEKVKLGARINQDVVDILREEKNLLLASTEQEIEQHGESIDAFRQDLQLKAAELRGVTDEKGQSLLDEFEVVWEEYLGVLSEIKTFAGLHTDSADLPETLEKSRQLSKQGQQLIAKIVKKNDQDMEQDKRLSDQNYAAARSMLIGTSLFALVCGAGMAAFIIRGIMNTLGADPLMAAKIARQVSLGNLSVDVTPDGTQEKGLLADMRHMVRNLQQTARMAERIAQGDLTVEVALLSDKDVLGHSLDTMVTQLRDVVSHIKGSAEYVSSGSQSLSASSQEMSQGIAEQAAAAEETSSSMEEMTANITQTTDHAVQTEQFAREAAKTARESGKVVNETVEAMKDIVKKVLIVNEIARQTHLLSLNATIEAARVGDDGKGFAVVASEIRDLAERSKDAAEEINELVESRVTTAEKAGNMLQQLVPQIENTSELMQEISAASKEQKRGIEQVNQSIQQLDQVVQQHAAVSENISGMAEEFSSQAEMLHSTIAFFQIDDTLSTPEQPLPGDADGKDFVPFVPEEPGDGHHKERQENLEPDLQGFMKM